MEFTPKTREEAEKESQFPIWDAGIYDFEVAKAEALISKSAKVRGASEPNMIKVTMNVFNADNQVQIVFDYLMPAFPVKLIDACECMGLSLEYQSGNLEPYQFEGKTGKMRLGIEAVNSKNIDPKTDRPYPSKNKVEGYVVDTSSVTTPLNNVEFDDPFNYDDISSRAD